MADKPIVEFKYRLQMAMNEKGLRPVDISNKLGISKASVSQYLSGRSEPRSDKLYKLCIILDCQPAWLLGFDVPKKEEDEILQPYYLNRRTADLANDYNNNHRLQLLFDAARRAEPEDIDTIYTMLMALKKKEKRFDPEDLQ